jgi:glutaredoxin
MECVICYEGTNNKTECNHVICKICMDMLEKQNCPYCRQDIKLWKEVRLPFYYFVRLFNDHYKNNKIYESLKVGTEYEDILDDRYYYCFEEKYQNCSWTTNYNQSIKLRIYNVVKEVDYTRVEFNTIGIESSIRNRYYFNFYNQYLNMDPYLKKWIKINLN